MISLIQAYWKIWGYCGSERITVTSGSELILTLTNDIHASENHIDSSGQGGSSKVICKKTKSVVGSPFVGAYWRFDNVEDFKLVEEKERRCFVSWEEAFNDKVYGKAIKELYDTNELLDERMKNMTWLQNQ